MATKTKIAIPPLDPELEAILSKMVLPPFLTLEMITAQRTNPQPNPPIEEILSYRPTIKHSEHQIPGPNDSHGEVTISVFEPKKASANPRPCMYYIHGGGMIMKDRFYFIDFALNIAEECDAICTSVEYRLAPEHPYPAGLDDCFAGLKWVSEHAKELGIDPAKIMVAGHSGGACLAAGAALLSRDRSGPKLCGQFLACPMLDDRNITVSSRQYLEGGIWNRQTNIVAWNAVLNGNAGKDGVSIYAAPARADGLSGLPTTFIDVGSGDILRDEAVAYASKLWAGGVQVELHVWPGGWHGFEAIAPTASLSILAKKSQVDWVKKVFRYQLETCSANL
jgi:acetyl esterase/lipase